MQPHSQPIYYAIPCGPAKAGRRGGIGMKALIQRVKHGRVSVDGETVGTVGAGYVVLLGIAAGDSEPDARHLAHRTVNLRIFEDDSGRMNRSVEDVGGGILVISQFTLYADTSKGNRPSFIHAGNPELASQLYEAYLKALGEALGETRVERGRFGARMLVEIANDGPVTIELNTDK